jgi:hypothetical protein
MTMTERRNRDDEAREILSRATPDSAHSQLLRAEPSAPATPAIVRRSFGLPIAVSRVVELPRAATDREWEQLISQFRTVFGVQGRATTSGGLREWSQGHLHISLEPTANGEQLRVSDLKDEAVAINGLGFALAGMGVLMSAVMAAGGKSAKALVVLGIFGAMSTLAFFAANLVRTPFWARERERQMQAIADHTVKLLSTP